ncbi:DUF4302 domain-containing protein [Chitinophaga sp. Mgbs1]|uniref:DUF4302 domain-containing protein n=1 Tax=Chitinophaga solisilvae TaxID=1233460 RepID=A0A9Q5D684_9BACT|nr:DUF4302 domain-containing protein [Chitinophaga solisilvae]
MRKITLSLILILAGLYACKKETDPVFDKSPDERINDTLHHYQQLLVQAPYGWKALIYPAGVPGSVFSFYLQFNASNRVQMFSDIDAASTGTVKESSWRLKALQQPSLLFDTYSYIHVLCDPDAGENGGEYGQGLGSDFEFAINGMHGDTLVLTGRFHRSKAVLIKATQQDKDDYYQHRINRGIDSISRFLTYFKKLVTATASYDVEVNKNLHQIKLRWTANGKVRSVVTGYHYTASGVALSPAFKDTARNVIISSIENIRWAGSSITCEINKAAAAITESVRPEVLDISAPERWYRTAQDNKSYWQAADGFHVNGVDDAFHIRSIPSLAGMVYWPGDESSADVLGFAITPAQGGQPDIEFGVLYYPPTFTDDGRVVFNEYRVFGTPPVAAPVNDTRALMKGKSGFYIVRTSEKTYDMVSASDGKSWITWVF